MNESNASYEARFVVREYLADPKNLLKLGEALRKVAGPWEKYTPPWDSHALWGRRDGLGEIVITCRDDSEKPSRDETLRSKGFSLVD